MTHVSLCIEGAEHTGKSTLAKVLSKITGTPVIHFSKDTGVVNGKFDYCNGYLDLAKNPTIFDRFYVTEIVYARFFNRRQSITPEIQSAIEKRLTELKYMLVLLDTRNILWDHKREQPVDEADNLKLKTIFAEVYETITIPKLKITSLDSNTPKKIVDAWYNYYT